VVDPLSTPPGAITETIKVEDKGGVEYTLSVKWNYKYVDAAGTTRVSVNPLIIKRPDATAGPAEDDGVDTHWDVYSGTSQIQHKVYDGIDLDVAADDQVTFNPKNPKSNVGVTKIRIKVGTDGDGLGSSDWVFFNQPAGLPTR